MLSKSVALVIRYRALLIKVIESVQGIVHVLGQIIEQVCVCKGLQKMKDDCMGCV